MITLGAEVDPRRHASVNVGNVIAKLLHAFEAWRS